MEINLDSYDVLADLREHVQNMRNIFLVLPNKKVRQHIYQIHKFIVFILYYIHVWEHLSLVYYYIFSL
jgi:hypothetical protein